MFQATLVVKIAKQLNMQEHLVVEIIDMIVDKTQGYLKRVPNQKGVILQIDRLSYGTARETLVGNDF